MCIGFVEMHHKDDQCKGVSMIGQNFTYIRERYHEYWNFENHDRPLVAGVVQRDGSVPASWLAEVPVADRWLDTPNVIRMVRSRLEHTAFFGEAFPAFNPNLGPDFLGAVMGCDLQFGESTSWAHPIVKDWRSHEDLHFDEENPWWQKIVEITQAALNDSHGDYLVGITDIHAGMDGLVSLRGPDRLCMDLFDDVDSVKSRIWQVHDVFRSVFERLWALTSPMQGGTTNWMGLLHPGRQYVTSCDFSCLISPEDFNEYVVPELIAELSFLDASIYHLDGSGALRHLDRLLMLRELNGIQWVPGAGQKPMREWIPVLKRIQDAGKLLQLTIEPEDLLPLCEALRPEGVHLSCQFADEYDAREAFRLVEYTYRERDK
jgi:hypothetical protein